MPFAAGLECARGLGLKSQKQWQLWQRILALWAAEVQRQRQLMQRI